MTGTNVASNSDCGVMSADAWGLNDIFIPDDLAVPVRNYKDSVFRMLFSEKKSLLSLYNALNGTTYTDPEELEINTLEHAIYLGRKNDISFIIQSQMYLYEHQSTLNPNMPLRSLFYVAALYTRMTRSENLHGNRQVIVPRPHFVVFYNGTEDQPERQIMRLSEAFEQTRSISDRHGTGEESPELELKTLMININQGYNDELKKNCRDLYGYMVYVNRVRKYAEEMPISQAVSRTINECIREGILAEFLSARRAEVMSMSIFEYDQEKHFRQIEEDSREKGWLKGLAEGTAKGLAEGRVEGRAEGRVEGRAELVLSLLMDLGEVSEELSSRIMAEKNPEVLKAWVKLSIKVSNLEQFQNEM